MHLCASSSILRVSCPSSFTPGWDSQVQPFRHPHGNHQRRMKNKRWFRMGSWGWAGLVHYLMKIYGIGSTKSDQGQWNEEPLDRDFTILVKQGIHLPGNNKPSLIPAHLLRQSYFLWFFKTCHAKWMTKKAAQLHLESPNYTLGPIKADLFKL